MSVAGRFRRLMRVNACYRDAATIGTSTSDGLLLAKRRSPCCQSEHNQDPGRNSCRPGTASTTRTDRSDQRKPSKANRTAAVAASNSHCPGGDV